MVIIFGIIRILFIIVALVSFFWITLGSLPGIIILIMYFIEKDKVKKSSLLWWTKLCLAGWPIIIAVFMLWALLVLVMTFLGIDFGGVPIGN